MLQVRRSGGPFSKDSDVLLDGSTIGHWTRRSWRNGGELTLPDGTYQLRVNMGTRSFELAAGDRVVASGRRRGRTVGIEYAGEAYEMGRASIWKSGYELRSGGAVLGTITRQAWSGRVDADLPNVPEPLQVFATLVAVALWRRDGAVAAGAAAAASSGS